MAGDGVRGRSRRRPTGGPGHDAEAARLAAQLHEMEVRLAALRAENERLRAEMEVRTRRRDGLLGERAQLEKQLARRDRRLAELEREIGTLRAGGAAPLRRVGGPSWPRARSWLSGAVAAAARRLPGLRGRGRPGPPAGPDPAPPVPTGEAPLVPFATEGRAPRVLAVAVFGLGRAELERVVDVVAGGLPAAGTVVPVFLTDCAAFEVFRARRVVFEYLPPPDQRQRFAPDLDWDLYVLRRLVLLRRKWRPVRIIAFGPAARAVLAAWRACRFEDEDIGALIHAPEDGGAPAEALSPDRPAGG